MAIQLGTNVFLDADQTWYSASLTVGSTNNLSVSVTNVSGPAISEVAVEGSNDRNNWKFISTVTAPGAAPAYEAGSVSFTSALYAYARVRVKTASTSKAIFNVSAHLGQA
jgi:hypothetical protein